MTASILLQKRKLVYGFGINDSDYKTEQVINGKRHACLYYKTWSNMLKRCYSDKSKISSPTYIGCSVTDHWYSFADFRLWMEKQDWKGKCLDKDIIIPGNKVYSPEACVFVNRAINGLLTDHGSARGSLPQGVSQRRPDDTYTAKISIYGKRKIIGCFDSSSEASSAYNKAKAAHIREVAMTQPQRIKEGLLKHAVLYETGNY